jgi:GNAT superfamily N-acetyltransferase
VDIETTTTVPDAPRPITDDDIDTVVTILVESFYRDPVWAWAFPDDDHRRDQHRALWREFVIGARRYPWTFLTAGGEATAVWIPPDGTELTDDQEHALLPMLAEVGVDIDRVEVVMDLLDGAHPHDEPHFHLSMLGTHPDHLGHGHGLGLLASTLREIDRLNAPAYLEASNVANVPLYARYGFRPLQTLTLPDGPDAVTMWRPRGG